MLWRTPSRLSRQQAQQAERPKWPHQNGGGVRATREPLLRLHLYLYDVNCHCLLPGDQQRRRRWSHQWKRVRCRLRRRATLRTNRRPRSR